MHRTDRWIAGLIFFGMFSFFAFWVIIGYVAFHFVEKFW